MIDRDKSDRPTVLASINAPDGARCVDIFARADGSFGFEEYRRDSEDPSGWFPIGGHRHRSYPTSTAARAAAATHIAWL